MSASKNHNIPKLLEDLNLIDYLVYNNYMLDKDLSQDHYLVFHKESQETLIVLNQNGKLRYKSITHKDKGNLINFITSRLENQTNNREINTLEALNKLALYATTNFKSKESNIPLNSINIKEYQQFSAEVFTRVFNLKQTNSSTFLYNIGITESQLLDTTFANTIYSDQNTDNSYFILKQDDGSEVGEVFYSPQGEVTINPFSDLKRSLWYSNQNYSKVCFVNNPIEAYCHNALNPQTKFTYISLPPLKGIPSRYQLETLYNYIDKNNHYLTLGTPDTIQGNLTDLNFIARYAFQKSHLIVIDHNHAHVELLYKGKDPKEKSELTELFTQIQKRNSSIASHIKNTANGNLSKYIDDETFNVKLDLTKENTVRIFIPRKNNQIHWFCKMLVRIKGFNRISFQKPQNGTFLNDQLKAQGLTEKTQDIFNQAKI